MRAEAPERDLNKRIVVATTDVFFPYQFRDDDGKVKGFANDVTDAVARAMNLPLDRQVFPNTAMEETLRQGSADVIQFWSETDARHQWADFSVPIARFETVAVVRRGDARIRRLSDLRGMRIGVGQAGNVGCRYVWFEHPTATPVFTETSQDFLQMLAAGEIDAAVMSRLTAVSMIERYGLKNLTVLEDRIKGDKYDVRYCFAVRKGDALLLARLNEGLAVIHRTGEFDEIYHRWFGRYEKRTFSKLELVSYVAAALALASAAATWGFLRQRTLSRRVAKQAAQLAEQRSLLAALYDRHPLATLILETADNGGVMLVSANPEALRLFRLDPAQALPRPLAGLSCPGETRAFIDGAVARWQATPAPAKWDAMLESERRVLETALVPLGGDESRAPRFCVLSNDVTERRALDNELAQSRRLRALGELVGGIAHEFNNLLTPILVTTSHARTQAGLSPALQADFTVIDNAARRAAELTKRLLTFGRKHHERPTVVHLRDSVESCFALLRPTVDRRVEWSLRAPLKLPPLFLNSTDLNQIVFNLVINARDTLLEKLRRPHDADWIPQLTVIVEELPFAAHRPERRMSANKGFGLEKLSVPTQAPIAWQRLTVEDNGLGIAPEIVDRIFEPFFTTKDVGQGTGLGLATVWHLTVEAGGDVTVDSTLSEGTRFHVTLPRWSRALEPAAAATGKAVSPPPRRGLRVLLAEDDMLVGRSAVSVLEHAGHMVTHCKDGGDAWELLERAAGRYDVLLFDLNMPRLNGIDLVRRVRGSAFAGVIAVISGRVSDEERQVLGELHVSRIIHKPFTAAELVDCVRPAVGGLA